MNSYRLEFGLWPKERGARGAAHGAKRDRASSPEMTYPAVHEFLLPFWQAVEGEIGRPELCRLGFCPASLTGSYSCPYEVSIASHRSV